MRAVLALTWADPRARLRQDRQVTTTALAVLAFAVTTALGLSVVGGLLGFVGRAEDPPPGSVPDDVSLYVILAWIAVALLLVPLLALGGAAARLGLARRDARLATLRLLGVTPREVVGLTVLETAAQGLVGVVAGIVGYVALLPVWTSISFQGRPFSPGELWVGWRVLVGALVLVPLLAAVSGAVSLRRVVVHPLGVARRVTPPGLRAVRALAVVAAVVGFTLVAQVGFGLDEAAFVAVLLLMLAGVAGALNLVGPWFVGLLGRVLVWRARTPATLLAGRRLVDDPKATWRVVGGLSLASFVAGVLSILPAVGSVQGDDPATRLILGDLMTGGMLTLAIAFVLAAASAGIQQASGVLDRRRELELQRLAGVPVELFDAVRRREVLLPLLVVSSVSAGVALVVLVPLVGLAGATDPTGVLVLLGCLVGGVLLMLAASETSRPLLRSVLRDTVVRPD